jgi:hypothetical protein
MRRKIIVLISLGVLFTLIESTSGMNVTLFDDNTPPNPPEIEGPTSGQIKTTYTYDITITDPDEDDGLLFLEVDFGDGIISEDCGCDRVWQNGEVVQMSHQWKREGTYQISARVQDVHGEWSEWSEPIPVTMPKHKLFVNNLLSLLIDLFPNIARILNF